MLVIKEEKDREAAEFNGVGADPEVADKATRRQFSAKYKRRIVREADRCTKPGELGALLLSDLGVTQSHSRPYVSDDNPFSEAQFKTLKYRPDFPERFGSI